MAEYIEREALIAEYDRAHKGPAGGARKLMVDAPTADVVPVVRCKNCEHGQFMPACSMYLCRCTGGKLRYADDYCNYGERKEQE